MTLKGVPLSCGLPIVLKTYCPAWLNATFTKLSLSHKTPIGLTKIFVFQFLEENGKVYIEKA